MFVGLMNILPPRCYQSGARRWEETRPAIRTALAEFSRTYLGVGPPRKETLKDQRYPSVLGDLKRFPSHCRGVTSLGSDGKWYYFVVGQ